MTSPGFSVAIDRILSHEGGYTAGANDPGGETNFGLSKRSYPNLDIKNLTRDKAVAIYKRDFWDKINGNSLPFGIAFQVLDFAVNSGIRTAIKSLQRAINVDDDGSFGPASMAALAANPYADTVMRLISDRLSFMAGLSTWKTFGQGWARRIAGNLIYAGNDIEK